MIVLTSLLTSTPDPQRGTTWPADPAVADNLIRSVIGHGAEPIILHDEPLTATTDAGAHLVERTTGNPYIDRWNVYLQFITRLDPDEQVWCVDASDVTMLHLPEPVELACGSEQSTLGANGWLHSLHTLARGLAQAHPDWVVLNAGVVGGTAAAVADVAAAIYGLAAGTRTEHTDMAAFNVVLRTRPHVTGEPIHTRFKAFEIDHPSAWFCHK